MSFHPAHYQGLPVQRLLQDLAHWQPQPSVDEGRVELHSTNVALEDAVTLRPATLLLSTVPDANLGEDHPTVDLPGVVLEQFLGGGGQGWVYTARVQQTQSVIAVKVLRKSTDDTRSTALREAMLCARVRHRNILRVFRAEQAGDYWVVLMELIQGTEIVPQAFAGAAWKACFAQLADALQTLTRARIVHNDVKPANILLRAGTRTPVLVDFGIALDLDSPHEYSGISGTPYYMAPEVFRSERPDPSWDAYALGVTAAVLLLSRPSDYGSFHAIYSAKLNGAFDDALRAAASAYEEPELAQWLLELLSSSPERRLAALDTARRWRAAM